jgi:predicted anti-sigma-YlaC factor YlaD
VTARPAMDCETVRDLAPLFVLDALEPDEAAAVRAHLADCDDAHAELRELAEAAGSLSLATEPVEPPAGLKSRLLAAAEDDLRLGRHPSVAHQADAPSVAHQATAPGAALSADAAQARAEPATDAAPVADAPRTETASPLTPPVDLRLERERRRFRLATLGAAAAILLAVALGGYALVVRGQLADEAAYREVVDQALQLAAQPGSATAVLAGANNPSSGLGVIGADGRVELAMRGLSATTGREVYTAWAIGADGTPRALGDFDVGGGGTGVATATSPVTGPGTVLAITREPVPGATAPHGPIVASGAATAPQG